MLRVEDLSASYGPVEVLHGVGIEVVEGELVALLGANGAGKTTLLRTVSGLMPVGRGRIVLGGEDVTDLPPHRRCEQGVIQVPEGRKLFPRMTVSQNLELGARPGAPRRRRKGTMQELFARFPVLADRRGQLAGTLSGGEQQQLAIARGLMGLPRALLLDEPTLGLAPVLAEEILEIVASLHQDGMTVLLVSQEVVGALEIADRAYVLESGDVAMTGTAAELLSRDDIRGAYLGL
jgi:branched-chain amino acid transport system ATP-binding protein